MSPKSSHGPHIFARNKLVPEGMDGLNWVCGFDIQKLAAFEMLTSIYGDKTIEEYVDPKNQFIRKIKNEMGDEFTMVTRLSSSDINIYGSKRSQFSRAKFDTEYPVVVYPNRNDRMMGVCATMPTSAICWHWARHEICPATQRNEFCPKFHTKYMKEDECAVAKNWRERVSIKVPENLEHFEKEFSEALKQTEDLENIEIDYSYAREGDRIFF